MPAQICPLSAPHIRPRLSLLKKLADLARRSLRGWLPLLPLLFLPIMGSASVVLAADTGWRVTDSTGKDITASSQVGGDIIPTDGSTPVFSGNTVGGFDTSVGGSVYGGKGSDTGDVTRNNVTMYNTSVGGSAGGSVYGGYTEGKGAVTGNNIIISGGSVGSVHGKGTVYGGYAGNNSTGDVTRNSVSLSNATIFGKIGTDPGDGPGTVYGGYAGYNSKGAVTRNSVTIFGGTVQGNVYGGLSEGNGDVTGNSVSVSNATVQGDVYGGFSDGTGDVTGNIVSISGGTVLGSIYGGLTRNSANGGKVTGNRVLISGTPTFDRNTALYGGRSTIGGISDVRTGNSLTLNAMISVGSAANFETWGFTLRDSFKDQTMLTVKSSGGAELGANAMIILSVAHDSGKMLKGDSFTLINKFTGTYRRLPLTAVQQGAGFVALYDFSVAGASGSSLTATVQKAGRAGGLGNGNSYTVTADDAGLDYVVGGFADSVYAATATGNTLILTGSPGANTALYGGYAAGGTGDVRTGNTLALRGLNFSARSVRNFQNYHFYLPANTKAGDTVLRVSETADLRGATVGVGVPASGTGLAGGSSVTLLKSDAGLKADANIPNSVTSMQGISLLHTFDLSTTDTELKATLRGNGPNPGAENISLSRTAAVAVLGLGSMLIADSGMSNAMSATRAVTGVDKTVKIKKDGQQEVKISGQKSGLSGGSSGSGDSGSTYGSTYGPTYGLTPFAAVSGGSLYYKVGDGADVKGLALMAGLAKRWQGDSADFLLGAFFEAGFGGISSYTSTSAGTLTGTNNADYLGGGILARVDVTGTAARGLYAEASARMGHMNQKYNNYDLRSPDGRAASYELGNTYYGLHAGLGYIWTFSETLSLDMSAKYFWNHQQGGDVRIAGDPYSFGAVDSHRVRAGGRLNYAVNEKVTAYAGAAWEHEFDGQGRATAYGLDMPSPTATGSTGVGELGLRFKPFANAGGVASTFSVDLSVQGFVGMREGVMGNLTLGWEF